MWREASIGFYALLSSALLAMTALIVVATAGVASPERTFAGGGLLVLLIFVPTLLLILEVFIIEGRSVMEALDQPAEYHLWARRRWWRWQRVIEWAGVVSITVATVAAGVAMWRSLKAYPMPEALLGAVPTGLATVEGAVAFGILLPLVFGRRYYVEWRALPGRDGAMIGHVHRRRWLKGAEPVGAVMWVYGARIMMTCPARGGDYVSKPHVTRPDTRLADAAHVVALRDLSGGRLSWEKCEKSQMFRFGRGRLLRFGAKVAILGGAFGG